MMKKRLTLTLAALAASAALAAPAAADCYADYKAKQDNPLTLHYGVMELPESACGSPSAAAPVISRRIAVDGWELLEVMSIFGESGLSSRQGEAGTYFLRY